MQEELTATYYLWQLYHIQKAAEEAEKELAEKQESQNEAADDLQGVEGAIKEKKKQAASLAKQKLLLEQKIKKRRGETDKEVASELCL